MSAKNQLKEWHKRNEELAENCEAEVEDPNGDLMYDAFVEFVEVMKIINELGKQND